jgi:glycosyltransferase involved in cell wall biosynthesis
MIFLLGVGDLKILKLSSYYEPEQISSSHLSRDLEEAYIDAGFEIEIYAPTPTRGVSKGIRQKYKKIKYEEKYDGKIKVYRFAMFGESRNPFLRAVRYILCNIIQYFKGISAKDIDLIIAGSTPPTQGLLVAMVKRKLKVPVIYNLQDIFPESLVNTGLTKKGSFIWKIGQAIENYTYKNADKIIVISEDFKKNIMTKGVPEEKIAVVHNWINENAVMPIERERNILFEKYNLDRKKFYITHCGNIGLTQNLEMLVDIAKELESYAQIRFLLIGDGVYKEELEKQILTKGVKNIDLIPFQPYEDISHVFSLGDIGLIISKANVGDNSIPSKTWSIMAAERFVLASFDINGLLNTIITKADCGLCIPADNKKVLKDTILDLFVSRDVLEKKGKNGRKYVLENLTSSMGTKKYISIVKEIFEMKS